MQKARHRGLYPMQDASIKYILSDAIEKNYPWLCKVVLFGSCATNRNKFASDVDVLYITTDNYDEYRDEIRKLKCKLCGLPDDTYADIDPKFMSEFYIENHKSTFLDAIRKEGLVLWTRNHT